MKFATLVFVFLLGFSACNTTPEKNTKFDSAPDASKDKLEVEEEKIIMFYGNSITAGYGVSTDFAFPALVQNIIDSLAYPYKVVNAGLSGETSSGGLNRIEWVLRTVPDVFMLELGGNDGLRGLQLNETKKNLGGIIQKVEKANPDAKIILAGMQVPPNLGQDYTEQFRKMFVELAAENEVIFIPFLLEGVGGEPDLNQSDGIHPNEEGHEIVAGTVWQYLAPLLTKEAAGEAI